MVCRLSSVETGLPSSRMWKSAGLRVATGCPDVLSTVKYTATFEGLRTDASTICNRRPHPVPSAPNRPSPTEAATARAPVQDRERAPQATDDGWLAEMDMDLDRDMDRDRLRAPAGSILDALLVLIGRDDTLDCPPWGDSGDRGHSGDSGHLGQSRVW